MGVLFFFISENRGLIVSGGFPFHKGDGACRAGGETVSQTVAVIIPQEFRFSVYHADGSFMAGLGAQTTAVTFFFINFNNFSYHNGFLHAIFSLTMVLV